MPNYHNPYTASAEEASRKRMTAQELADYYQNNKKIYTEAYTKPKDPLPYNIYEKMPPDMLQNYLQRKLSQFGGQKSKSFATIVQFKKMPKIIPWDARLTVMFTLPPGARYKTVIVASTTKPKGKWITDQKDLIAGMWTNENPVYDYITKRRAGEMNKWMEQNIHLVVDTKVWKHGMRKSNLDLMLEKRLTNTTA